MRTAPVVLVIFTFLALGQVQAQMPAEGFAGKWKVNFAKSKFPGPPPQVDECTVDPDGTVTVNETSADGKSTSWHYTPVAGKAVAIEGRESSTVLVKRVNSRIREQTWNFKGGRTAKSKAVLSADGQITTFTMDGTDKDGKPFHEMVVYDKQ